MVMRVKVVALWAGLVLLALLTLMWTVLIVRGEGMDWDWGISILIVWLTTGIVAAGATVFAAGRLRILMGIAMLVAVTLIALLHSGFDEDWDVVWASWLGAVCLVQIGLLSLLDLRASSSEATAARWLRRFTYSTVVVFGLGLSAQFGELLPLESPHEDWYQKMLIFVCMLNAVGTIGVYLLAGIHGLRRPVPESVPAGVMLSAACPRCNAPCTFGQGKSSCPVCGLRVTLEIEEPRCECGYLLYKLDSDQCPECGRAIRRAKVTPRVATPV